MRFQNILFVLLVPLFLGGCGVGQSIKINVQGPHYLQTRNYAEGEAAFRETVARDPDSGQANYFLGRFLLGGKKVRQALPYLKKAVALDPENADHLFWYGVALGENGRLKEERAMYDRVLEINNKHLQALIYLGHNLLKSGKYEAALEAYQKVIKLWPRSPSALYNRALIAKILKRKPEERIGWLTYLSAYPSGALAIRAADHLNLLEDFRYRNHHLGVRTVTLTKIWFVPFTAELAPVAKRSLDVVGATAVNMNRGKLQVVVYQLNNKKLARARAVAVKKYLLDKFPALSRRGIGISWFDSPEKYKIHGKKVSNPESVRFFISGLTQTIHPKKSKRRPAKK